MGRDENGVTTPPPAAGDLNSLLCSSYRDFLVRNTGDEVKVDRLKGKKIGLYFSASWCGPCREFTPTLIEEYNELLTTGDFEIVFVSCDKTDDAFKEHFQQMPWLAIPFSDSRTRNSLTEFFSKDGLPYLVILDENADILTDSGVEIIMEFGVEAYPFTHQHIKEIMEHEEAAKREQSLRSILEFNSCDYVISADGKNTPVSELEGKIIGFYFSISTDHDCVSFTRKLKEVYRKLKEKGENFEIVSIPLEEGYKKGSEKLPWFSLPVKKNSCKKLARYFELTLPPTLVIIGSDGKTLHHNVAQAIEEHGVCAYPFTPEKFLELEEIEKAKEESQTLESILVAEDQDFVIGKDYIKVRVADLVGKNILLFFSAHWCPPCLALLPTLIEVYHKIKAKDDAFEVIFISSDKEQLSFDKYFCEMPWLALPFGDRRKQTLSRIFKVCGLPKLVAIGPTGKTVTTAARSLIVNHGADAYPFTEERVKEIEEQSEARYLEKKKRWPEKIKHKLHEEHDLVLTNREVYDCDSCDKEGEVWSFCCTPCEFDLHPECALEDKKETKKNQALVKPE